MRTLIAFMLMVGVAWGGDLSDIATAEDYGLEDITGDVTTSIAIHPIGDTYTNEKGELCQDYNDGSSFCGNTDSIPKLTNNLSDTLESRIAALEKPAKELSQQVSNIPNWEAFTDMRGDFDVVGYLIHLQSRIASLESQVKELRQQVLPMSCFEYYREFKDMSELMQSPPVDGALLRSFDGAWAWYVIKPECQ